MGTIYVALDAEAAGPKLGRHSILSIGACVVTREKLTFEERLARDLVFYRELKPQGSLVFEHNAIKVGASELMCLEKAKRREKYLDTTHPDFDPNKVLTYMQRSFDCMDWTQAFQDFGIWIRARSGSTNCFGVTDAVFFDPGIFMYGFGMCTKEPMPMRHTGICISSLYKGRTHMGAKLSDLEVHDWRIHPHRADEDAAFLADQAQLLLF